MRACGKGSKSHFMKGTIEIKATLASQTHLKVFDCAYLHSLHCGFDAHQISAQASLPCASVAV
jgi:hypothetical protein